MDKFIENISKNKGKDKIWWGVIGALIVFSKVYYRLHVPYYFYQFKIPQILVIVVILLYILTVRGRIKNEKNKVIQQENWNNHVEDKVKRKEELKEQRLKEIAEGYKDKLESELKPLEEQGLRPIEQPYGLVLPKGETCYIQEGVKVMLPPCDDEIHGMFYVTNKRVIVNAGLYSITSEISAIARYYTLEVYKNNMSGNIGNTNYSRVVYTGAPPKLTVEEEVEKEIKERKSNYHAAMNIQIDNREFTLILKNTLPEVLSKKLELLIEGYQETQDKIDVCEYCGIVNRNSDVCVNCGAPIHKEN